MAFIMQSDQDMASKAVQQQLMEDFKDMMKENHAKVFKCQSFKEIPKLVSTEQLSYKSLSIITIMFPNLNDRGLHLIDERIDEFFKILEGKAKLADVTWQNVFSSLIFEDERKEIEQQLHSLNSQEERVREVKVALRVNEGEIDSNMV